VPRVDYDRIAHLYDEPMRAHPPDERLRAFLAGRPDLPLSDVRVLDVGCGTGSQLLANRTELPSAMLVGVDRFRGMLRVGSRHGARIGWVQGDGARLPLASDQFDFATNQFSYHHISDQPAFVREVFRVLRPGGRFVLTNIDPWSMPEWEIYQFFPEAFEQDQRDFLSAEAFALLLREAGFVEVEIGRRTIQRRRELAAFLAYASERHRTSQFMAISDAAYQAGLERVRGAVSSASPDTPPLVSEVCLLTIQADKPAVD
jgi:ubiquinone/menaquinone biosynthesis C-methylase UbiE